MPAFPRTWSRCLPVGPKLVRHKSFLRTVSCPPSQLAPEVPRFGSEIKTVIFLATPQFAPYLKDLTRIVRESQNYGPRKFVGAIVDSVPIAKQGIICRHGYSWFASNEAVERSQSEEPHSITFCSGNLKICIPLANTLFETGDRSVSTHESVEITLPHTSLPVHSIPFKPLTQPRKIAASVGNILQTLESSEGNLPASFELEKAVSDLIKHQPDLKKPLDIFAYITDSISLPGSIIDIIHTPARIHRVLSGGGGWGAKAGLLSLDPQDEGEAETEFHEGMLRGEGSAVKPGEWVQFGYADRVMAHPSNRVVFGSVEKELELDGNRHQQQRYGIRARFGGGSEKGLKISIFHKGKPTQVKKLDVPGATLSFANMG